MIHLDLTRESISGNDGSNGEKTRGVVNHETRKWIVSLTECNDIFIENDLRVR